MKNSLEIRSPFLDTDLGKLSESIPSSLKVKNGTQKYLLKKLAERYLPDEIIYKKKTGFELPIAHWFRTSLVPAFRALVLDNGSLASTGWFNIPWVATLLDEHSAGTRNHSHRLWSILWLEIWFRLFIDKSMQPEDSLSNL